MKKKKKKRLEKKKSRLALLRLKSRQEKRMSRHMRRKQEQHIAFCATNLCANSYSPEDKETKKK